MANRRIAMCQNACPTTKTTTTGNTKQELCMRPGPLQRNPYLNFLREYREKNCGLSAVETVRRGAQAWKCLTAEEKARYIVQAFYTRRKTLRNLYHRGRRRTGKSKSPARSRKSKRRPRQAKKSKQ